MDEGGATTFGSPLARARPGIVGRGRELERLRAALAEALAGRGRLVVVVGEPGIGKSRVLDELAFAAGAGGLPVVWGRAWEAGGAPAYWPWLAVLEALVARLDDRALREALGAGAGSVARLVPEIELRLGAVATAEPPSADEARFRLWRSVLGLVRRAAAPAGLVILLEDLHAADESTLALLLFVAGEVRGLRVLLVVSHRDAEAYYEPAVGDLLARIARAGETLALGRLEDADALALLAARTSPLAPAVNQRICARAQGNPLFLEEIARLEDQEPGAALAAGAVPIGVRDVIRHRLDRLGIDARATLDLAAVIGDEIDPSLLAAVDGSPARVRAGLDAAARAGLVHTRGPRPRFSHALVREALYEALADERRQQLHADVARVLAARHADAPPAAELAHHLLAGPAAELPAAIDFAITAAQQALARHGYEEAVVGLARAAGALAAAGDPPALRGKLAHALGAAHIRRGEVDEGRMLCREAARLAQATGDTELLARAALTYGEVFTFGVVDPILIDLLEEALAARPQGDDPVRIALMARLAAALQPTAHTAEPARIAREAIAAARRLGDDRVLLRTLQAAMAALMDVAPPRERLALNREAEDLARNLGDRAALLRIQGRLVVDHMGVGELAAADARIDIYEAMAQEQHAPWMAWRAPLFRSMRAMMHGRFADAEACIARALEIGRETRDPQVERCVALHRESLLRAAERHDELEAQGVVCRAHRTSFFLGHLWQAAACALIATRREDPAKARFHLDSLPADARPPIDNLFAVFHVAEPAAFVGDPAVAEQMHALVSRTADEDVMLGMAQLSWEGPARRLLALLEARLGRWDAAERSFAAACARLEELDARPLLARTRYEHGRALLDAGRALTTARALIERAAEEAASLGLTGLTRLCQRRLASAAAPAPGPAAVASEPVAAAALPLPFVCAAEGEVWTFTHAGTTFRLKDSLGLRYLARLFAEPDCEIHVLDLVAAAAELEAGAPAEVIDAGDAGELLDDEARRAYTGRVMDLRADLAEAEAFADAARAQRLREELDFLTAEIGRAVGLGGRTRRAGAAAERARSAVQRRIKNAIGRIREHAPALADHLQTAVRTGHHCVYRPRTR